MNIARLALRMLAREWRAGELRVLVMAVMIAVAGLASVNAFTMRMHLALSQESNRLLGADLVLVSDHESAAGFIAEAVVGRDPIRDEIDRLVTIAAKLILRNPNPAGERWRCPWPGK